MHSVASRLIVNLDRRPLWLWVLLSLVGYITLAIWFPLLPHYNRVPWADVLSLAPSLAEGLAYGLLVCLLFAFFALAYRRVRQGTENPRLLALVGVSFLFSLPLLLVVPENAAQSAKCFLQLVIANQRPDSLACPGRGF